MENSELEKLRKLAALIRTWIVTSTHRAGSGHPTSALSAVELMTGLFFGGTLRYFPERPGARNPIPASDFGYSLTARGRRSPMLSAAARAITPPSSTKAKMTPSPTISPSQAAPSGRSVSGQVIVLRNAT